MIGQLTDSPIGDSRMELEKTLKEKMQENLSLDEKLNNLYDRIENVGM